MGWQFRRVNTEFTAFTLRGTSDWDDRSGGTPFNGEPHVWAMRKSEVRKAQWADGNLEFQVLDTGSVTPAPDDDLVIAARSQNGSIVSHSNVEVAEIIIYDSALSDEDVHEVQGYLAHKWGLVEPMPASHPYKNSKPVFENRPQLVLESPLPLLVGDEITVNLETNRPNDQIIISNLPPGLTFDSNTDTLTGTPTQKGTFTSIFETSNYAGSISQQVVFEIKDYTPWDFGVKISFPGYLEESKINNFPVYVKLSESVSGFNYQQFSSEFGHDLRFLTSDGLRELPYEPIEWNTDGTSSFWVLLNELDNNTSIRAIWGNRILGSNPPTAEMAACGASIVLSGIWMGMTQPWSVILSTVFMRLPTILTICGFQVLSVGLSLLTAIMIIWNYPWILTLHRGRSSLLSLSGHTEILRLFKNSTLFESGSAAGRHLNVHFPWSNSRFYWDAGSNNQYDRIEKEDSNYLGAWVYWTLQKDSELGIMRIYKNGELFMEGFNKTRPFGGPVEHFRLGSGRLGGAWWNGWVDEFRIGLFMESPESIKASYNSQRPYPESEFANFATVEGPPVILENQTAQGYANDPEKVFSYNIEVFPSADSFSAVGLPAGIELNSVTGELRGYPLQGGEFQITVTASNSFGDSQQIVALKISEVSSFTHSIEISMAGYSGSETLLNFPTLITMDSNMDANFSLNSFVSDECYDLRFYDTVGRDLAYEIESVDHARNSLVVWVRVAELNASTSIFAFWGNENLSDRAPVHAIDGSTWSEGFRGVWHLFPMEITDILVDSSPYRNHAINVGGITAPAGKFGTGRSLFGGGDQFIKIPRASSLNSLGRDNYSFSTWVNLENQPDTEIIDSFYGIGYQQVPNDRFFNDINQLIDLRPSGARIFKEGPRQGLYLNGADFQNANIGINSSMIIT